MSLAVTAAEALMRHGGGVSYGGGVEAPDSVEWLRCEAEDLAALWPCPVEDVVAFLADVGWFDPVEEPGGERAAAVHADPHRVLGS